MIGPDYQTPWDAAQLATYGSVARDPQYPDWWRRAVDAACAPLLAEIERLKVLAVPQWQAIAEKAEAKLQGWANHAVIYHHDCAYCYTAATGNYLGQDE